MKNIFLFATIFILSICFPFLEVKGQDLLLSQPYNNPLTIAPSFAGMTNGGRVALSYRNQWPNIASANTYSTYAVGLDYFLQDYNSGIGALITDDSQGNGVLRSFDFALQYSYRIKLKKDLYIRPGIQANIRTLSIDYSKLIFSENIAVDGSVLNNGSITNFDMSSYTKLDAAFSSILYGKNFWVGFNIDHLIQNNVSVLNEQSKVPLKSVLTAQYSWIYEEKGWQNPYDETVTLGTLIQNQASFNQMDIGVTWTKNPVQFGIWYRNFIIPTSTISNLDAMIFVIGFDTEDFKISYSYDLSLSKLIGSSDGAHEISLVYYFNQVEKSPIASFCR